jgi:hypothetical protein
MLNIKKPEVNLELIFIDELFNKGKGQAVIIGMQKRGFG